MTHTDHPTQLAHVDDVIEQGQPIPANVVTLRDADGDRWLRVRPGRFDQVDEGDETYSRGRELATDSVDRWWPMTVTEVDPRPAVPAAPQPVVLRLPEMPKGAVALVGENGAGDAVRCLPHPSIPALWVLESDINKAVADCMSLADVLNQFGPVTVEFAPPREPRVWPKFNPAPELEDLPAKVQVEGHGTWTLDPSRFDAGLYVNYDGPHTRWLKLTGLRELGEVREVLS